jgi:hypothetical protein
VQTGRALGRVSTEAFGRIAPFYCRIVQQTTSKHKA